MLASSLRSTSLAEAQARAAKLKLMVFDVDGVLTDGSLFYTDEGVQLKAFNSTDGLGLRLLQNNSLTLAVISGRQVASVDVRMQSLGIEHVFQGTSDKLAVLQSLLVRLGLNAEQAGFMGDDLIDLRVMAACGFSAMPVDGHARLLPYADWVSSKAGGRGAVREACEFILAAQGKLDAVLASFLPSPTPVAP